MLSMTKGMIIFTRMSKICESYSNKLHQIVFNQIEIYIYIRSTKQFLLLTPNYFANDMLLIKIRNN